MNVRDRAAKKKKHLWIRRGFGFFLHLPRKEMWKPHIRSGRNYNLFSASFLKEKDCFVVRCVPPPVILDFGEMQYQNNPVFCADFADKNPLLPLSETSSSSFRRRPQKILDWGFLLGLSHNNCRGPIQLCKNTWNHKTKYRNIPRPPFPPHCKGLFVRKDFFFRLICLFTSAISLLS